MIRCGAYLRLSREEEGEGESNSIQAQRIIIHQYVKEQAEMELIGEWVDDGYSGSNFARPGFQAMLHQVLLGGLDCILVKDLSRFGREYIETGRYLQQVFPRLGIRFVAVADHYDSQNTEFMEQALLLPVMNLLNDAYCRDISQKVRSQQRMKRGMGEYIGAFAGYGYRKSREDLHWLERDEEAAAVVKAIYFLRLSGLSPEKISLLLNYRGIPSPRGYKSQNGSRYITGFSREEFPPWSPMAVRRILQNPMYTGVMIQGKREKISYKLPDRRPVPQEEWAWVEGGVPALVPDWLFRRLELLQERHIHCKRGHWFCRLWDGIAEGDAWKEEDRILDELERKLPLWLTGKADLPEEDGAEYLRRLRLVFLIRRLRREKGEIWVDLNIREG